MSLSPVLVVLRAALEQNRSHRAPRPGTAASEHVRAELAADLGELPGLLCSGPDCSIPHLHIHRQLLDTGHHSFL